MVGKRILWIEDNYYSVKSLVAPLEGNGYQIDVAESCVDAYRKCLKPNLNLYDAILLDLILKVSHSAGTIPEVVTQWQTEGYLGIGLLKWLTDEVKVKCPIIVLTFIHNPLQRFHLHNLTGVSYLEKSGLRPSALMHEVKYVINSNISINRDTNQGTN